MGQIYLALVQLVLLYRSDKWVLTPRMKRLLGRFHRKVACRITGRQTWKGQDRGWFYPPLEDVSVEVSRLQNTVAQYIVTMSIMERFLVANQRPGPRVEI